MATSSPDPTAKTRHLRPRESVKKTAFADASPGSNNKNSNFMMADEVDDELSANTTASHYLGANRSATKRKNEALITVFNTPKRRRVVHNVGNATTGEGGEASISEGIANEELQDVYCWECHKECVEGALDCVTCPRTFHPHCIPTSIASECTLVPSENWTCPACLTIMKAECADTRSWAMQLLNIDQLCTILGFALQRMKHPDVKTSEAFHNPVPRSLVPDYYDVIFHPMDLSSLDKNIKKKLYASTEAFLEDAKWILHNSIIYNGSTSRHTTDAKLIIKICRHELAEIELCPDCYLSSCIRKDNWFTEPCSSPHCLVWAKLKGFPFWPAKALRISSGNNVDVRFFGAHDRAWIPLGQVYLLSSECPLPIKNTKKFGLDKAVDELNLHIKRLRDKFGEFHYASSKTEFKMEHLYFCSILFGKAVANSETAQRMLATSAGRRYRDLSSAGADDQSPCVTRKPLPGSNFDEQQQTFSVDDGQSSDNESEKDSSTAKEKDVIDLEEATNQDAGSNSLNQRSYTSELIGDSLNEGSHEDKNGQSSSQQPPLRVKLSLSNIGGKRKSAEKEKEKTTENSTASATTITPATLITLTTTITPAITITAPATTAATTTSTTPRNVTQSPDSTSPNGLNSTATTTTAVQGSQESAKTGASAETGTVDLQIGEVSSVGKRTWASAVKTVFPPVKEDEPPARKRNLQSVLEKMHSNVQQQRPRSVSPIGSDSSGLAIIVPPAAPAPASKQLEIMRKTAGNRQVVDKRVNVGASTSAPVPDCGSVCEKYLEKINDFVHTAMSDMMREIQPIAQQAPSREPSRDVPTQAQLAVLRSEFTRMQCFYNEAVRAMKHTAKITFTEVQQTMEAEKMKAIEEMKRKFEEEKKQIIADTKAKQWCANCGKEAVFYCCWNTSYCDYPCQQQHWPKHQATCAQIRQQPAAEAGAHSNPLGNSSYVGNVFVGGNRLSATGAPPTVASSNVVPLYTSTMQHGGLFRTTTMPTNAGQSAGVAANLAALVRKR